MEIFKPRCKAKIVDRFITHLCFSSNIKLSEQGLKIILSFDDI
jgi:hypothetical protein